MIVKKANRSYNAEIIIWNYLAWQI